MTITNKYGERGSPCLRPFAPLKKPHSALLIFTENQVEVMQAFIQYKNFGGNLSNLNTANMKSQDIESKAFLISILRAQQAGPDFLW